MTIEVKSIPARAVYDRDLLFSKQFRQSYLLIDSTERRFIGSRPFITSRCKNCSIKFLSKILPYSLMIKIRSDFCYFNIYLSNKFLQKFRNFPCLLFNYTQSVDSECGDLCQSSHTKALTEKYKNYWIAWVPVRL